MPFAIVRAAMLPTSQADYNVPPSGRKGHMQNAQQHYETHLGPVYSWMIGDIDAAFERSAAELDALHLPRSRGGAALDLGAGFGLHALALARRGYAVTAVDSSALLLDELRAHAKDLPVRAIHADIVAFGAHVERPLDVILCMGDTLTHLPELALVDTLLTHAAAALAPRGVFTTTFRDYASAPLSGAQRFIPVRSDAARILTCFLEYGKDHVTVYDLLHERKDGRWLQRVSSYPKLRLDPQWVVAKLTALGLAVQRDVGSAGLVRIRAVRP
jgi:2-polyprenyl-3-methyl-5-hydroxy-6-metoxy-1,4-benzoquinol methylase